MARSRATHTILVVTFVAGIGVVIVRAVGVELRLTLGRVLDLIDHRSRVRTLHEGLFYRPLLEAFAASPATHLAPEGAVAKITGKEGLVFTGVANVFESEEDMVAALERNEIKKGDVVIIRYEGPKGGPGMREMLMITGAIKGAGLGKDVLLVVNKVESHAEEIGVLRLTMQPADVLRAVVPALEDTGVVLAVEALGPQWTDFLRNASEASELAQMVDSSHVRLHLDCSTFVTEIIKGE